MYALVSVLFSDAGNRVVSTGQAHTVYGATQKAGKAKAGGLRGTRAIRYWFNDARPRRAPLGYVGVAG